MKFADLNGERIERQNCWDIERGDGWSRLIVATSGSPIDLIADLVKEWRPPFFVLYVHVVPRTEHSEGRFQSPAIERVSELKQFLLQYKDLFENDGRQNIWIGAPDDNRHIVYDRHEVLYVYGDDERISQLLTAQGYNQELAEIPVPHAHHYDAQFDASVISLFDHWEWNHSPLEINDD